MQKLKTILLSLILMFSMLFSAADATEDNAGKRSIVIDVRTEAEWATGHLDGAVLIPYERIGDEISKASLNKDENIYLYCRTGRRSGIALETLKKAGFENLINLETVEKASKVLNKAVVQ